MIQKVSSKSSNGKIGAVMVLGAGVAGIQASLDLADMGYKVYLVEDKPSIGGAMAQLDKTFPTNDCAMCLLSPKLVDTARHQNIEIITNSELQKIDGLAGNFTVTINKRPRYIDEEKCTGCGTCTNNCPVRNIISIPPEPVEKIELEPEYKDTVTEIIDEFKGQEGGLLSILQNVNFKYNWLPENVLRYVAQELDIQLSHIYTVAAFYNTFSLKPRGRYIINVCCGTSCHVRGGGRVLQKFQRELNVGVGETTPDMLFTLESVMCLGCCGLSPAVKIGEEIYGKANKISIPKLLNEYRRKDGD